MGLVIRILRIIGLAILALVALAICYVVYYVADRLPWKKTIRRDDKVWTSELYLEHFADPEKWPCLKKDGKFPHVISFIYEGYLPWESVRPELLAEKEVVIPGEIFRLIWNERNADENAKSLIAAPKPKPVTGTTGGTKLIKADVIAMSDREMVLLVTTRSNGYQGGFEVVEITTLPTGVKVENKYIWHNAVPPVLWGTPQWLGVYIQLCARLMWTAKAFHGLGRLPVPIEEVDFQVQQKEL